MELGLIGLGRMGANMAQRLRRSGHRVVGYARHASTVQSRLLEGAISAGASSLTDIVNHLISTSGRVGVSGDSSAATA